jgi:tetratricopeptide (TPR) repeat protein
VFFEARVQAVRLLMMLSGESGVAEVGEGRIVGLQFQGKIHGFHTDDLICTIESRDGNRSRALLQMKRSIAPTVSNTAFADSIAAAWLDFSGPLFRSEADRLCILFDVASSARMEPVGTIVDWARTSLACEEFRRKVDAEQFSSQKKREALSAIEAVVQGVADRPVSPDELFRFIQHLQLIAHDLAAARSSEVARHIALISVIATTVMQTIDAPSFWANLETTCLKLNGMAATLTLENLASNVDPSLVTLFKAYRLLKDLADPETVSVRPDLAEARRNILEARAKIPGFPATAFAVVGAVNERAFPMARAGSANAMVDRSLDHAFERIRAGRYADALSDLEVLGQDLSTLDVHQTARWYFMRGACRWQVQDSESALSDLVKANEVCGDDPRIVAGAIRALTVAGKAETALAMGLTARERFASSVVVWVATAQAQLSCGQSIDESDVPPPGQDDPDVLQVIASARHGSGRLEEALEYASRAADYADASLFHKLTALTYALELAAGDSFSATFRLLPDGVRKSLARAMQRFESRETSLWDWQSPNALRDGAVNLAYAGILLDQTDETLKIVAEARSRGVWTPLLLRAELIALERQKRAADALVVGLGVTDELPVDAIVELGQIAANTGDGAALEQIELRAMAQGSLDAKLAETFRCFGWFVLANQGRLHDAVQSILSGPEPTTVAGLVASARLLIGGGQSARAGELIGRALATLPPDGVTAADRYMVGEVLYEAGRYSEAADMLAPVALPGQNSQLHRRLMHCYILTNRRAEGRRLLDSLPAGWEADASTRRIVMDFAQLCTDWLLVSRLCDLERAARPSNADVWMLSIVARARIEPAPEDDLLSAVPMSLEGDARRIAQIASFEVRHGYPKRGLDRLYALRRTHMGSREIGSLFFTGCLALDGMLPQLNQTPAAGGAGTSVKLVGDAGEFVISIDPEGMSGLPEASEFKASDSADARLVEGAQPGAQITVDLAWGGQRVFTVRAVQPVYRRLLELAREEVSSAVVPNPQVFKVEIPEENGKLDLRVLHGHLAKNRQMVSDAIATYDTHPCTIGWLSTRLGRDPIEVVAGWGSGPALRVEFGQVEVRAEAATLLADRTKRTFVVDSASLTELHLAGVIDALELADDVLVTSHTRDIILNHLEMVRSDRSIGNVLDVNGEVGFLTTSEIERHKTVEQMEHLANVIASRCTVVPVYGPQDAAKWPANLRDVLSSEEYEGLLLAAERKALLVSLDQRYRTFARYLGIESVGLQPLMTYAVVAGKVSRVTYALACIRLLEGNRSFISLRAEDLVDAVLQGSDWVNRALTQLCAQLRASTTEISSAIRVVVDLLCDVAANVPCQVNAFRDLALRLFVAVSRNPSCPSGAMIGAMYVLSKTQRVTTSLGQWLIGVAGEATLLSDAEFATEPWGINVVYATRVPQLCSAVGEGTAALMQKQTDSVMGDPEDQGTQARAEQK